MKIYAVSYYVRNLTEFENKNRAILDGQKRLL